MSIEKHPDRYESLLRAVLMFHRGGPWTEYDSRQFGAYLQKNDGDAEATTKNMCDAIREALGDA